MKKLSAITLLLIAVSTVGCAVPITNKTQYDIASCYRDYSNTRIGVTPVAPMGNPHLEEKQQAMRLEFVEKCLASKGYQVAVK